MEISHATCMTSRTDPHACWGWIWMTRCMLIGLLGALLVIAHLQPALQLISVSLGLTSESVTLSLVAAFPSGTVSLYLICP
jgi:hypothetical membrane protein